MYNMHTGVVEPASNGAIGVNMSIMTAGGYNLMILMPHHSSTRRLIPSAFFVLLVQVRCSLP